MEVKYAPQFLKDTKRLFSRNLIHSIPRIIRNNYHEVRYALQRAIKGYDDVWCFDTFSRLDDIMPKIMRSINKVGIGAPIGLTHKQWKAIREKIANGFEAHEKIVREFWIQGKRYENRKKKFDEGIALFVKYYDSLWD